jgi:hypothetical protein
MDYNPTSSLDFNNAEPQQALDAIPPGTIAKVRMMIKRGGYNEPARGWTDDCATCNHTTGAVYLNCEFTVLEGAYARQKVWSLIGLHSINGPKWGNMGRSFIRAILASARGFTEEDTSPQAVAAKSVKNLAELDGLEFFARIDLEKNEESGAAKNIIKVAITKSHRNYPGNRASTQAQLQAALSRDTAADALPVWAR